MTQPAPGGAVAQPVPAGPDMRIVWEVKNRFRLFREEKDFLLHVEALQGRSILASEQYLALGSEGRGWARNMINRLCIDPIGRIPEQCNRDGTNENYLAPIDHRIGVRLLGAAPGATCAWTFNDGENTQNANANCAEEVRLHVAYGRPTAATVDITGPAGVPQRATADIQVRDLLIAGMGDSIASGEGNPDRPVQLADDGFCFRQFVANVRGEYFRPGRAGFRGDKACDALRGSDNHNAEWARLSARWLNAACHRSLYSYQVRTALALAVQNPHIAVTFLPLACTGASIDTGIFSGQRARELNCGNTTCPRNVTAQITQLQTWLEAAHRRDPKRKLDLLLLTVGANDIDFSGLVANVIIDSPAERTLFKRAGIISSVEDAQSVLDRKLPRDFARLRTALKPLVGGDLARVVYVSYGQPAMQANGTPCPGGRDGFDVHPAFGADPQRLRAVAEFVQSRFLPRIKALATCSGGTICGDPPTDRMTFADAHQTAFLSHGVCARAVTDPDFDKDCFSVDGNSFVTSPVEGATEPLACGRAASEFRAYAPRERWIRTANDSYFTAMTFPEGAPAALQPSDLHDATWGLLSAVYGGAVHPTAEGHAAMADAALPEARRVLHLLPPESPVVAEPLPLPNP
ncbi:MAG TPA: hypothetical protein VHA77_12720 [Xanthobacteraceae bacterium]|nr:hypothetical protein [Xanthobacteraceae bacterium]